MIIFLKFILKVFISALVLAFLFSFVYNRWVSPDVTGNARSMQPEGEFITVDGYTVRMVSYGSGGRTFVLLHDFGSSADTWKKLASYLDDDNTVYALDLAGFGYSDRGAKIDYRMEKRVERMDRIIQTLGIREAIFGGNGFGANLALAYAEDYPEKVGDLVLISPSLYRRSFPIPKFLFKIPEISSTTVKLAFSPTRLRKQYLKSFFDQTVPTEEEIANYLRPYTIQGTEDTIEQFYTQDDTVTYDETRVSVSTLVIYGNKDKYVPKADMDHLLAAMSNARIVNIENVGHFAQEEAPSTVGDEMLNFLSDSTRKSSI